MITLLDLLFNLCLGVVFALCARDRLRVDGAFAPPAFMLVLSFTGIIVVPTTLYLYWAHPAWSWLYLVDPADVPGLAVVPVLVVHCLMLIGGWYLGARLVRADKPKIANYFAAGSGVLFVVLSLALLGRLGRYGTFDQYTAGESHGLMEVRLGYILIAIVLGVGVAAGYVALELLRDSRRMRAK